jgi:CxxC motif-containing protein (DUF1111 family)
LRLAPSLRGAAQLALVPRIITSNDHELASPGRFGRTASEPSLEDQVSLALSLDLGIGSPLRPGAAGDCTPAEEACLALAGTRAIEADTRTIDALVDYLETLRPRPSALTTTDVTHGEALLTRFGCVGCHHASYTIPADPALTGTTSETIRPYTDLRLHDLGEDLADPVTKRWRTAPLRDLAEGNLLHDARAADPLEAILWHGGEAVEARERVRVAPPSERAALLAFLARL